MIETKEIIIRILFAVLAGGLIGLEREIRRNSAGFRTHMLVCLGACLAMLTNEYLYNTALPGSVDIARMASYVISGIGFLGAGAILKDGIRVRGLTTAAGLWVVACIGIAIGAGFYTAVIVSLILVFIILALLKTLEKNLFTKRNRTQIVLQIKNSPGQLAEVMSVIGNIGVSIKNVNIQDSDDKWVDLNLLTTIPNNVGIEGMHDLLDNIKGVRVISIDLT